MTIHKNSEKTDNPSRTYTDYLKLLQPHSRLSMTMCASRLILAWKRFAVTLPRLRLLKRLSTWVSKQCVATPLQEPFFFYFFFSFFSAICLSHLNFEILLNHFMPYKTFFLRCLATLLCFYQAILSYYFYLHINILIFHMYYVCVLINSESYVEIYVEDV